MEPRVLLLDEVTSALDPELVGEVLAAIRRLAQEGMTMLVVTRDGFAREVSDRVVFMDEGSSSSRARRGEVFDRPRHDRTRAFVRRFVHPGDDAAAEPPGIVGQAG
jgi:ABC-type polar amino acid transport system ATPase subunit